MASLTTLSYELDVASYPGLKGYYCFVVKLLLSFSACADNK